MSYRVALSEAAEAEAEAAYLWRLRHSPDHAALWYDGLLKAIRSLADLPRRCSLASSVEVTGYVTDPRPLLIETAACAVPLLSGGGMRVEDTGRMVVGCAGCLHRRRRRRQ